MRRPFVGAAAAAALLLALVPGGARAAVPGTQDQVVDVGGSTYSTSAPVNQTFTAGVTGVLTHVEVYCSAASATTVWVIFDSYALHTADCGPTAGWVDFVLPSSSLVGAGTQHTLVINNGYASIDLGVTAADYAGGEATEGALPGTPITGVSDVAFRTYVVPIQTVTYGWSPAAVPEGVSTPVTLTLTVSFPEIDLDPLDAPIVYLIDLSSMPFWTGSFSVSCSAPVNPADCTEANVFNWLEFQGDGSAVTVTITVQATAQPSPGDPGQSAQAAACVSGADTREFFALMMCESATAYLDVGPAPTPTPPPTTTTPGGGSGSSGGQALALLAAAVAGLLGAFAVSRRESARSHQ
jgi:hypothetical protein